MANLTMQTTQATKLKTSTKITIGVAITAVAVLGVALGFAVYLGGFSK